MLSMVHHSNYKYRNTVNNDQCVMSILNNNSEQGRSICVLCYGAINLDFHVFVIINLCMKAGHQTIDFFVISSAYTTYGSV